MGDMLNSMLHPIDSLKRVRSEREQRAQELQDNLDDAEDQAHDYATSTFEQRFEAALKLDKLRGKKKKDWVTRERFQAYDEEGVEAWQESEQLQKTIEQIKQDQAAYEQERIADAIDQDRDFVGQGVMEAYAELEAVDDENIGGEIESFEDDETERPLVQNKAEKIVVKKKEIGKLANAAKRSSSISSESYSSEKSYSGNGERKPGKGLIEGIKGWFRKMFGRGESK
ncbi:TPA: hypothetical protein DEP96_03225 [Candidatus Uhrbacteria bacterium]|nr:hypothetical protein [Candidatus Uhrbacteria bacterium]